MAEKMYIKQMYEEGVSKSEIQKRTKLNYRTVCKYADKEDWNEEKLPNVEPENYPVLGKYTRLYSKMCKECRAEILCVEAEDAGLLSQVKDDNENTRNFCRQDLCILL